MTVRQRVEAHGATLTATERRIAEVILRDEQAVAFGTVAELAAAAATSGASVVRLANRLGFQGFVGLQSAVQRELGGRLRPAAERIRRPAPDDVVGRTLEAELDNVRASLAAVDRRTFSAAVARLASARARVVVLPGSASYGIALHLADQLGLLRDGVSLAWGPPAAVTAALAPLGAHDAVVAIDLARYDVAVLDSVAFVAERGAAVIALTDSALSPLAGWATAVFAVSAEGAGPFDSHVGALVVANALASGVARRLKAGATRRLDAVERAWRDAGVLADS